MPADYHSTTDIRATYFDVASPPDTDLYFIIYETTSARPDISRHIATLFVKDTFELFQIGCLQFDGRCDNDLGCRAKYGHASPQQ